MRLSNQKLTKQSLACTACLILTFAIGCTQQRKNSLSFAPDTTPCQSVYQQIEYPDLANEVDTDGSDLLAASPITISQFQNSVPWELSVEECVELALRNSKIMQKLGGVVVNSPVASTTLYDPALVESAGTSVESALAAFDTQMNTSFFYNRSERSFNNPFIGGGAASLTSNVGNYRFELSKATASGATYSFRSLTDYNRNNSPVNFFNSTYDVVNQLEVRQPLGRGRGTTINRIAGPNAIPGQYNGVMIARIRSDISLADFEAAVRNLVRDVENNYWELYFAYRDLDTKVAARESARATWENRKLRYESGVGRPDDEAQARQQYFNFKAQAQNALTGVLNGQPGVLGAERNLRRLLSLNSSDGRVIRPISEPAVAPVSFDWDQSQIQALGRRVEIRKQKWTVRQREMELMAAKALNRWRVDLVGQYGFRGFGDSLLGSFDEPNSSAVGELFDGDLDDWQVGIDVSGAIGNRRGYLAIRNAELNLNRERAILKEQQRQILHDLNAAFTEVDRAMENLKTSFNSRVAVQEELDPKRKRVNEGQDQVFFLLDVEQRAANAESNVHRAIADYNQALLNFALNSGGLLSRYNIHLREGDWCEDAQCNAINKACTLEKRGPNNCDRDNCPVTLGAFDQQAAPITTSPVSYNNSLIEPAISTPSIGAPDALPRESNGTGNKSIIESLDAPVEDVDKTLDKASKKFDFNSPARVTERYLKRWSKR